MLLCQRVKKKHISHHLFTSGRDYFRRKVLRPRTVRVHNKQYNINSCQFLLFYSAIFVYRLAKLHRSIYEPPSFSTEQRGAQRDREERGGHSEREQEQDLQKRKNNEQRCRRHKKQNKKIPAHTSHAHSYRSLFSKRET